MVAALAVLPLSQPLQAQLTPISQKALKNIRIYIEFESGTGYSGNAAAQDQFRKAAYMGMRILQSAFPAMHVTWVTNPGDANVTFVVGNYNNRLGGTNGCISRENPSGRGGGPDNPSGWIGCSYPPRHDGEISGGRVYFNTTLPTGTPFLYDDYTFFSRQELYDSYQPATNPPLDYGTSIGGGMGWIDGKFGKLKAGEDASHIVLHEFGHTMAMEHHGIDPLPFYGIPYPRGGTQEASPNIVVPTGRPSLPPKYYGGNDPTPWLPDLRPLAVPQHQMAEYVPREIEDITPAQRWRGLPSPMLHRFHYRIFGRDFYDYLPAELKAKADYAAVPGTIRLERPDGSVRLANNWTAAVSAAQLDVHSQSNPYFVTGVYPYAQQPRIAVGSAHVLALRGDGTLWAWGRNDKSQLGDNGTAPRSAPYPIGTAKWTAVAAGENFSLGLQADQSLWAWGDRTYGQVGDGVIDPNNPVRTPKKIGDGWVAIAAGTYHALALRNDGTLWGWGYNGMGQLGNDSRSTSAEPVPVYYGWNDWISVSTGTLHTLAQRADGSLWAWGWNDYGTLGNGGTATSLIPVQVSPGKTDWAMVEASHEHSIATDLFGRAWTWGRNHVGQIGGTLGSGSLTPSSSRIVFNPMTTSYMKVAAGQAHSLAIRKDGSLWSWGWNSNGQLGANQTIGGSFSSPVREATTSIRWKDVYAGAFFSVARDEDDVLWTWGDNTHGQLGNGTSGTTPQNAPAKANWCQVDPGIGGILASQSSLETQEVYMAAQLVTGCVRRVEFFNGATKIAGCDKTAPPYECRIANMPVGTYSFTARVVDLMGRSKTASPVSVNVHYLKVLTAVPQAVTGNTDLNLVGSVNWKEFPGQNRKSGATDNLFLRTTGLPWGNISPTTFSWTGGTPVASRTGDISMFYIQYPNPPTNRINLEFPATSITRKARVYFAGHALSTNTEISVDGNSTNIFWDAPPAISSQYMEVEYRTAASKTLSFSILSHSAQDGARIGIQAIVLR